MADVWVYHPELDQHVQIPESAFLIHARSGWIQQDPPPPEPEEAAEEEAKSAKKTASKKTPAEASDEE